MSGVLREPVRAPFDIDAVREEAARVCIETARWTRGERGPLRDPISHGPNAEFSDPAFGVAGEVALAVGEAISGSGIAFQLDFAWDIAARLLRKGWQRGQRIETNVVQRGAPS